MNVLVIAPHMDDEVLGCGGTILRHGLANHHVAVCIVTKRAYDHRYDEDKIAREKTACRAAREILGYEELFFLDLLDEQLDHLQVTLIKPLEELVNRFRPQVIYFPHRGDLNQDHQALFPAVRVISRPYALHRVDILRVYEVPSSTDQVPGLSEWPFAPNHYVDITGQLDQKIQAMSHYSAEGRPYPHPRSARGLEIYARKRGMEAGMEAAEAFMVLRDLRHPSMPP